MTSRWAGAGVVALAAGVATCALLLVGGTAPAGGSTVEPRSTTTTPLSTTTTTTTNTVTTTTTTTNTITTTTTTTTTTAPATSVTTTTTAVLPPVLVPTRVVASTEHAGLGGRVTFDGRCATGHGPIVAWITDEHRGTTSVVDTGLATSPWTFVWTAPTDERDVASFVFRFWCGDPSTFAGDLPDQSGVRVAIVASAVPNDPPVVAPTHPPAAPESPSLPETG